MSTTRAQISVSESDLAVIDEAAQAAAESRSAYMVRASLERAGGPEGALTAAQVEAVEAIVRRVAKETP